MPKKETGGPAFPVVIPGMTYGDGSSESPTLEGDGMTLRDWFAGQFAAAAYGGNSALPSNAVIAREAYALADAMLKEREKE